MVALRLTNLCFLSIKPLAQNVVFNASVCITDYNGNGLVLCLEKMAVTDSMMITPR